LHKYFPLIVIDKVLLSDEIVEAEFVCNLSKCKGACCEDGDAGAPLSDKELDEVKKSYEKIKPLMTPEGIKEVEKNGLYRYDREFGWVTPTVDNKICAYGFKDKNGVIKCAFEESYNKKEIKWKKPISCHLYPIKKTKSKYTKHEMLNYEPRKDICAPACKLGKELKVPVYVFLKEALIREYGTPFYNALCEIANDYYQVKQSKKD
jgi:Protein of unknown function (DUF3109)